MLYKAYACASAGLTERLLHANANAIRFPGPSEHPGASSRITWCDAADIARRPGRVWIHPGTRRTDIANALNVSRAQVHGVVTFYHHFRDKPAGRRVVQIGRAETCQSLGYKKFSGHQLEMLAERRELV